MPNTVCCWTEAARWSLTRVMTRLQDSDGSGGRIGSGSSASEADLAAFYDRQAAFRDGLQLGPQRVRQQERFIALLKTEHRHSVLEIGCGPGTEGLGFVRSGIHYTGVDLSEENVRLARAKGLDTSTASCRDLPFPDHAFSAIWTMSTLLHIPNSDIDTVLAELVRVAGEGAPIGVGLWSGDDEEGLNPEDLAEPRRFFSLRSDETVRGLFGRHGVIEDFVTWTEGSVQEPGPGAASPDDKAEHYQFLILRTPARPS